MVEEEKERESREKNGVKYPSTRGDCEVTLCLLLSRNVSAQVLAALYNTFECECTRTRHFNAAGLYLSVKQRGLQPLQSCLVMLIALGSSHKARSCSTLVVDAIATR